MGAAAFAVLAIAAKGVQAYGQYKAGKAEKTAYNYNADIEQQKADVTRQASQLYEFQATKNLQALIGNQRTQYAASGIDVTGGSPIEVMTDTLSKGYLDIAIQKYNYETAARGFESQSVMDRYAGKQKEKLANAQAISSLLSAGGDAASSFSGGSSAGKTKIGS